MSRRIKLTIASKGTLLLVIPISVNINLSGSSTSKASNKNMEMRYQTEISRGLSLDTYMDAEDLTMDLFPDLCDEDGLSFDDDGSIPDTSSPMDVDATPGQDAPSTPSDGNIFFDEVPENVAPPTSSSLLEDVSNHTGQVSSNSSEERETSKTPVEKTYLDVLCERGGGSNNHPGNQDYLEHVKGQRKLYQALEHASEKTSFSQTVVDWVKDRGGRFLERHEKGGPWYVVDNGKACKKASQALREKGKKKPKGGSSSL